MNEREQSATTEIFRHGLLAEKIGRLKRSGDTQAGDPLDRKLGDALSIKEHGALCWPDGTGDDIKQCRLAGTVRSDDPEDLVSLGGEAHLGQCYQTTKL